MLLKKYDIRKMLLVLFVFTIPNSVVLNNLFLWLIILYWIFKGDKQDTLQIIKHNIIAKISLIYFSILTVSLLWSPDLKEGLEVIFKEKYFLFLPVFMSLIKENERELLIKTFILSVTLSELISYGVKLNILPEMFHATRYEPVPFIHHVQYSPFVAFGSFLLMYYFLFVKSSKRAKALEFFFIVTMCINLFLTGGRAGQVVYFFLLIYTFFYLFKFSFKSMLAVIIIIPLLFGIFYSFGGIFKERVNMAIYNVLHFNKNKNTSIGERLVFWQNTIHLAKQKPILGYGTGSFKKIYGNYSKKVTPNIRIPAQPHNMYLFVFFQTGIIGLSVFLYLFYKMFEYGLKINDRYKFVRLGFVGYFLIIMLSDSYLFSHFHQSLFVIFTAVLYKRLNYE